MRLKLQWSVNNELRITTSSDPLKLRSREDSQDIRRQSRYALSLVDCLHTNSAIDRITANHGQSVTEAIPKVAQLNLLGEPDIIEYTHRTHVNPPRSYTVLETNDRGGFYTYERPFTALVADRDRTLGIIEKSQRSLKSHSTWGEAQRPKKFTKNARHSLLECGAAIDRMGKKDDCSVLTLTLPGSCKEAYDALARWSGWIVNRQLQHVRRYMKGRPCYWFFVWEWQQRGALHQHWCVAGKDYAESQHLAYLMRDCFYQCLKEIGEKEGIDMFLHSSRKRTWRDKPDKWNWHEQQVEKGVGQYFSKYATKEALKPDGEKRLGAINAYYPSRWHGSSSHLKRYIQGERIEAEFTFLSRDEVNQLVWTILEWLRKYDVIKAYEYDFKVEPYPGVIICDGAQKILYFGSAEYSGVRTAINNLVGTSHQRNKGESCLQDILALRRSDRADTWGVPRPYRRQPAIPSHITK